MAEKGYGKEGGGGVKFPKIFGFIMILMMKNSSWLNK